MLIIVKRTLVILFVCCAGTATAQWTRPERTNYEETSRYGDVTAFIDSLRLPTATMFERTFGYSVQGKRLPMIVVGDLPDGSPESVRRSGKLVLYLQGNIHGGEVEGKEVLLELLRELRRGIHAEWRRRIVLLIVPILNADGNDMISLTNRPRQHGPVAGMGQRANGQGLDLNRDHMKLETPEVRSFVRMMNEYDPHIVVDLHTTNGSFHGYHITYSFAVHPSADPVLDTFAKEKFFPAIEQGVRAQRWRTHRYGDYLENTPAGKPGYYFWAHEPRFNSNYVGIRNRIAVLSEAYSYIPFKDRIAATRSMVRATIDAAYAHSVAIKEEMTTADRRARKLFSVDSLAVRARMVESFPSQEILLAPVIEERNPYSGETMYRMNEDSITAIVTAEFYRADGVTYSAVPVRYLIPDSLTEVIQLLRDHGIRVTTLTASAAVPVQRFTIVSNAQSDREFQKHKMRELGGSFEAVNLLFPAGTAVVDMAQPLSRLAFLLLEPESDDGVAAWNVVDKYYGNGRYYPIYKVLPQ